MNWERLLSTSGPHFAFHYYTKNRDVQNSSTMFQLILPADSEAATSITLSDSTDNGNGASMEDLMASGSSLFAQRKNSLESIGEDKSARGLQGMSTRSSGSMSGSASRLKRRSSNASVISMGTKSKEKSKDVICHFRVLLDGSEKFIWLQAAAELGRLVAPTTMSVVTK